MLAAVARPKLLAVTLLVLVLAAPGTALPPEPDDSSAGTGGVQALRTAGDRSRPPNATELQAEADAWRLTASQAAAIGEPHGAGKIRICISPYTPGLNCSRTQPDEASGYQVELFKAIARNVSWLNESQWYFSCLEKTTAMVDGLIDPMPNGSCMIAPCNIVAFPRLMERGMQPSVVVDKDGLLIMVKKLTNEGLLLWSPFKAFHWEVWLMLVLTGLVVGTCIVGCDIFALRSLEESRHAKRRHARLMCEGDGTDSSSLSDDDEAHAAQAAAESEPTKAPAAASGKEAPQQQLKSAWYERLFVMEKKEYQAWRKLQRTNTRRSVLRVVGMADSPTAKTLPAQIVLFGFGLLLMLITMLYTASSTAIFTRARMVTSVKGLADLRGRAVGTWTPYAGRLKEFGIAATSFPWDVEEDEEAMLRKLSDGSLAAIVLDAPTVRHFVSKRCEFVAVGLPFSLQDHGYGFNARMPRNLTADLNKHIREAILTGVPEDLFQMHVQSGDCPDELKEVKQATVKLQQVSGLWLALALCMLAGALLLLLKYIHRRPLLKLKLVVSHAALERAQAARVMGLRHEAKAAFVCRRGSLKKRAVQGDHGHHNGS